VRLPERSRAGKLELGKRDASFLSPPTTASPKETSSRRHLPTPRGYARRPPFQNVVPPHHVVVVPSSEVPAVRSNVSVQCMYPSWLLILCAVLIFYGLVSRPAGSTVSNIYNPLIRRLFAWIHVEDRLGFRRDDTENQLMFYICPSVARGVRISREQVEVVVVWPPSRSRHLNLPILPPSFAGSTHIHPFQVVSSHLFRTDTSMSVSALCNRATLATDVRVSKVSGRFS